MPQHLLQLISTHNYQALFLLILIEEAGCPLPLPGESLIVYAGSRIARHQMSALRVFAAVLPASAIGCTILYVVALTGGRALVLRFLGGSRNPKRLDEMEAKVARIGPIAVLLGRLTPGIRVPTGIAAGLFRIPYHYYLPFALLATCIRLALFLYIGATAQHLWALFFLARRARFLATVTVLAIAVAFALAWRRHTRPRLPDAPPPVQS